MKQVTKVSLQRDLIAFVGEFLGTLMFLFFGLGGIKTALVTGTLSSAGTATPSMIMFISTSMGLSLLISCWTFYRISGGLFNPAVTLSLLLAGCITPFRAAILTVAQLLGGIAGAALVNGTTVGGVANVVTTLADGMSTGQGLVLEALLTSMLCFTVLMLAAEKHKATYLAPVGIGLTLFCGQLYGTFWTGCGMNPARSLGPSVVSGTFPGYHWIYHVGPMIGSLAATIVYKGLKWATYEIAVAGQDADAPPDRSTAALHAVNSSNSNEVDAASPPTSATGLFFPKHSNQGSPRRPSVSTFEAATGIPDPLSEKPRGVVVVGHREDRVERAGRMV